MGLVLVIVGVTALVRWRAGKRRLRVNTLAQLQALSPAGFEQAVADLLHDLGYRDVRRSGGAGDLNVDIWCRNQASARIAVQCKRYGPDHRVGSPEVQTFIGMIYQHHGADHGMFVTTSSFTAHAERLASEHRIQTVNGAALAQMIVDVRIDQRVAAGRRRLLRAPVFATALPLGLLLLLDAAGESGVFSASSTAGGTRAQVSAVAQLTQVAQVDTARTAASPTGTSSTPSPVGTLAAPAHALHVANTNAEGVYLRRTPVMSDRLKAYPDGTKLQAIGPDTDAGGVHWRHVAAPDGTQGYVPSDYVVEGE
jgi:restriction system protein